MLPFDVLFPGRFLKAGHLGGVPRTLVIAAVKAELIGTDELLEKGEGELKAIMSFKGVKRQLSLNKTNGNLCKAMWGSDAHKWVGKRLTLWPAPNPDMRKGFGDETCVRVYGSPDIAAEITAKFKMGWPAKAYKVTLKKTQPSDTDAAAVEAMAQQETPTTAPASAEPVQPQGKAVMRFAYGGAKGKPLAEVSVDTLVEAAGKLRREVEANPNASWGPNADAAIAEMAEELAAREKSSTTGAPRRAAEPGSEG